MVTAPQIQFRQEFIHSFERMQSQLRDTVTTESVIKGNQATFLVAGSGNATAVTRGQNGHIPSRQNDNNQFTTTLIESHDLVKHTNFDIFASQGNQRLIMQKGSMAVINRDIDSKIIDMLTNATNSNTTAETATLSSIAEALRQLRGQDVPMDGRVTALVTPAFYKNLIQIKEFSNADYVSTKPMVDGIPNEDMVEFWLKTKWIVHTGLPGMDTASESCFFYHQSAIGHAIDQENIDIAMGKNEEQAYQFVRHSVYHNAKLLQNSGVYKFLHKGA